MATRILPLSTLAELVHGQEADFFALLSAKELLLTREGKPYFKVSFRDDRREVTFPIWSDAPWALECRDQWECGQHYKLRAIYRDTPYGPQLDIRKIRSVQPADAADGFDPLMFLPRSRVEPSVLFAELLELAQRHLDDPQVRGLVVDLLLEHRERLQVLPAATRNHHAYVGGYLEHVVSVTRTCIYLAEKYASAFPDLSPPLNKDLVVAGGILHDIGKVREYETTSTGAVYSESGTLIGHILQGRDLVREQAGRYQLDPEWLLRLEHIIVSHQRLPEWGSPKPPMTPEALLVHMADDTDAKFQMMVVALNDDPTPGAFTSNKNQLHLKVYRGSNGAKSGNA